MAQKIEISGTSTLKTGPALKSGIVKSTQFTFSLDADSFQGETEKSELLIKFKSSTGTRTETFALPAEDFTVKNLEEKTKYEISYEILYNEVNYLRSTDKITIGKGLKDVTLF